MSHGTQEEKPTLDLLVPLSKLAGINEIDAILRPAIRGGREETHAAIEKLRKIYPGREREDFWRYLRKLRRGKRQNARRHVIWTEEDIEILREHYAIGRAGARRAVQVLLARHSDWTAHVIRSKAKKLGFSTRSEEHRLWSHEEQGYLLWSAGEKPVGKIARKLGRSVKSVHQKLSSLGVSGRVRIPKSYPLYRVSKLLGVSEYAVRCWFQEGLFPEAADQSKRRRRSESGPRLSLKAIVAFCVKDPDKINARCCDPDLLLLLEDKNVRLRSWHGLRQHMVHERRCPRCGRVIRGNAYFRHVKRCTVGPGGPSQPGALSVPDHQASPESNV